MFPGRSRWVAGVFLSLATLLAACAPIQEGRRSNASLLEGAQQQGIPMLDPLALSAQTRAEVRAKVGTYGTPEERLHRLMHFLVDSDRLDFQYHQNMSLTAEQAYHARGGDCTSYSNLLIATARELDIRAYYVRIADMPIYYEHQGVLYLSSHLAVGWGVGSEAAVIDFSLYKGDWKLGLYHPIDDQEATALFNSNLAVVDLVQNRPQAAEKRLRFLLTQVDIPDLVNDLAVALSRQGRAEDAYQLTTSALLRFPDYQPLYVNAATAARESGHLVDAAHLDAKAEELSSHDPFFWFGQGLALYQREDYRGAAERFRRALDEAPDSTVLLAWCTRANLSAGDQERGKKSFTALVKLNPHTPLVSDLVREYPALKGVTPIPSGKLTPGDSGGGGLAWDGEGPLGRGSMTLW